MSRANVITGSLLLLAFGYYSYTVFLADDALINRSEKTVDENGGYQIITTRLDDSQIIETYNLNTDGSPLSHTLIFQSSEPGSEPTVIKQGTFVPKY